MLVLARKPGQEIWIGEPGPDQVRVEILDIKGEVVRLGVTARKDIPVHRREVAERREK